MLTSNNIITYNDIVNYFILRVCDLCDNVDDSSTPLVIPDAFKTQLIHKSSGTFNILSVHGSNNKKIYTPRNWSIEAKQIGLNDNTLYNVQKYNIDNVNSCVNSILAYNNMGSNTSLIYISDMYKLIQLLSHIVNDTIIIYVSTYNHLCYYAFNSILSTKTYDITDTIDFNNDTSISNYYKSVIDDCVLNNGSISVLSCAITSSGGHEWPNN